jgi:16S rRNA (adenine1518-N6/adenine1519-N6)-dimethyltransferase
VSGTSTGSSSPPSRPGPGAVPAAPETARGVDAALAEAGVRPARGRGQSFLLDPFVADAEAALVEQPRDAPLVELGGGLGTLTAALLRRGYSDLTVVELEPRLARRLTRIFGARIRLVTGDALAVPLGRPAAVVGNLPYASATPILLRLLKERVPRVVAMVQIEVAERLAASPGSGVYGRLTLLAQLFAEVELYRSVGPEAFHPRPRVTSRVLTLTSRPDPLAVRSVSRLEDSTRVLFSSRRKQLGNLLPRLTPTPDSLAETAGWPSDWRRRRPEELPPQAFYDLANALEARRPSGAPEVG